MELKLLAYYIDELAGIAIVRLLLATAELCRDSQYMTNKLYSHLHSLHLNASHYNPAESGIRTSLFSPLELRQTQSHRQSGRSEIIIGQLSLHCFIKIKVYE